MLLYNFCKYYNYSFNSLAIFCGNRIELQHLCSLISDIDCKPSFSLFDGTRGGDVYQFSGLTICANICYGTIFFQLMTNHHIILILVLVLFLSQLDQRLSIQSLQLRLKSANKEKTAFISSITTVLVYLYLKRLFVIKT